MLLLGSPLVRTRCVASTGLGLTRTARYQSATTQTAKHYFNLLRVDKPIGTWLLFWPCAWSASIAAYAAHTAPSTLITHVALFGTGALVMRGAGCVVNDLWDRNIDRRVERTQSRPIAAGQISPRNAIVFLATQLSVGLCVLVQFNWYTIYLGASSLALVVLYPLAKRVTYWPQLVLGLAFNWGALVGSSAILGACDWLVALPLYFGSVCWTIVYDTIYAHQDIADDKLVGVKSTAILFEPYAKPILSLFSAGFVSSLAAVGYLNCHDIPFYAVSVLGAAAHLTWQIYTVNLKSRSDCWNKFKSNRNLGFIVAAGIAIDYAWSLF